VLTLTSIALGGVLGERHQHARLKEDHCAHTINQSPIRQIQTEQTHCVALPRFSLASALYQKQHHMLDFPLNARQYGGWLESRPLTSMGTEPTLEPERTGLEVPSEA
jgi:hypothetical protein